MHLRQALCCFPIALDLAIAFAGQQKGNIIVKYQVKIGEMFIADEHSSEAVIMASEITKQEEEKTKQQIERTKFFIIKNTFYIGSLLCLGAFGYSIYMEDISYTLGTLTAVSAPLVYFHRHYFQKEQKS